MNFTDDELGEIKWSLKKLRSIFKESNNSYEWSELEEKTLNNILVKCDKQIKKQREKEKKKQEKIIKVEDL